MKRAIIEKKPVTTYSDYRNRKTELTEEELAWFYSWVEKAKQATGCPVEIIPYDHELYAGNDVNALGCCITTDPSNQLNEGSDTFITIDCYFIDECWRREFKGQWTIENQTLPGVIAHEIAHLYVWRHGKKHTALTEKLLQQIQAA